MSELAIRLKISAIFLCSIFICSFGDNAGLAQGALQSWNTNQRERSQRLLSAAMTALNKSQLEPASKLLIQATQADPTDAAPFACLGMTYVRQGKYSEALEALKKSYQISRTAEALLSTGFAYYLQHDYDAAIESWTKALQLNPKMIELSGDIGFAYMRKGDFVSADESFRKLINARPSSQLAYQGLAVLNYLAGNFAAARKAAEHAQSIQSYFPVLLLQAKLDFLQGDAVTGQKRVAQWQRSASNKRSLVRSMTAIGYPVQHDFHWDPFLMDNFDNGRLLVARSAAAKEKGGKTTIVDGAKRQSSSKKGKAQDALASAKQAQFAAAKDFYITRELALIEMATGDYAGASSHFSEVLQLCPMSVVDYLHLARVQAMQGKTAEASYAVAEFRRQRPDEKIAAPFLDLAKGTASNIPELSPQPEAKASKAKDSGF